MKQKKGLILLVVIVAVLVVGGIIYVKTNKAATNKADQSPPTVAEAEYAEAHASEAVKGQVLAIKESLFPAIMKFAEAHGDQLPTSLTDVKPYFSGNSTEMDDKHWEIKAQGKMTPLLTANNVILAEQKNVPPFEKRLIIYTDGHVTREK